MSDDVARNHKEAAPHSSTMPFAERGKDATRDTTTSTVEEDDTPEKRFIVREIKRYFIVKEYKRVALSKVGLFDSQALLYYALAAICGAASRKHLYVNNAIPNLS
ncbi:hypothetical protein NDU88_003906 [Pleurodeles waltl]|uniref:Uncharacterized protein n=1 Tax=Pleurodeles waltl TaxID=8319 RepID=A0AAV7V3S7_PLEWA|nr:hypothetical protein NDU88_003906 [Pleurodeles waltl]